MRGGGSQSITCLLLPKRQAALSTEQLLVTSTVEIAVAETDIPTDMF